MKADPDYVENLLERLMLVGVAASAVCMVVGLVMFLAASDVSTATSVVTGGLIVLMATPALRVAAAVQEAVQMRDWYFVAVTGAVVLLLGLTLALALDRLS